MELKQVKVEIQDGTAVVTIDRHEKRNMLGQLTLEELDLVFADLKSNEKVTAVVVTGAGGKAFCAGAELDGGFDLEADVREFVRAGQELFNKIESFPKPVVAAVEGYALGGGCELMLACDVVVAAENAAIGLPEAGHGLMPGWRGTQVIPRIAGKNAAMEMLLLGGRIRAPRAAELGLVNRVVPRGEVVKEALDLAARLGRMPAHSIRLIKDAVIRGRDLPLGQGLEIEKENFAEAFQLSGILEKLDEKDKDK